MRQSAIINNKIKLTEAILAFGPQINFETWDKIAYDINLFRYREHRWNSPYFFFNGAQCLHIFQKYVSTLTFEIEELEKESNESKKRSFMEAIALYRRAIITDSTEIFISRQKAIVKT